MNFSFLQKECNGTYFMKYIVYRKINHPERKLNRLFESEILTKKFTYDGRKYSVELILSLNILVVGISRFQNLNGLKHIKRYDSRSFYQIFNHPRTVGFYGFRFFPKGIFPNGNFPRVFYRVASSQMCKVPSSNFPRVRLGLLQWGGGRTL